MCMNVCARSSCSGDRHGPSLFKSPMAGVYFTIHRPCVVFNLCPSVQMDCAENDTEIQAVFAIDEFQSLVYEAGFRKPLAQLSMEDKSVVSSILLNYHCMTKVKAAMDQYLEGLESLGLLSRIQQDPSKWKNFFVDTGVLVDSGIIITHSTP